MRATRRRLSTCVGRPVADNPWIGGVALDSRRVRVGDLFIACRGTRGDGHDHIDAAIHAGARAVVVERDIGARTVPVVRVENAAVEAGRIAARFFGYPSRDLGCIGVTGTNGKTTVACFIAELLSEAGMPAGYGGTLGWGFRGQHCPAALTTEDAVTIQRRLADMRGRGARWVSMEVSSHALEQHRADEVEFDVAVFTNLTRDHLDYHGSMERYGAAKSRLFDWKSLRHAIVNLDDDWGRHIASGLAGRVELIGFGSGAEAALRWRDVAFHATGISGTLVTPWGERSLELRLMGEYALANVAAAIGAACAAGASLPDVAVAAARLEAPPGRMQFVRRPNRPGVVVDYAHTPDALEKVLHALRRHCTGRVICVFGCGGDRDRGKRPLMAAAVEAAADHAFVTSDNPRSEDPAAIAAEIQRGFVGRIPVTLEIDRYAAIEAAIAIARPEDVVLVAGKGHEDYQEVAGVRTHFSDLEAIEAVLGS